MLKNYFQVAWRNLKRNTTYTGINILGLALGIAGTIVIFSLVKYHLSFDTFHTHRDRIYRIVTDIHNGEVIHTPGVPSPLGPAFGSDYAFAEKVARVASLSNRLVTVSGAGDNRVFEEGIAFAEPAFFDIMNFPLLRGSGAAVLGRPNTAVVTERIARKYFGDQDPVGKMIRVDNKLDFMITGVLRNLPKGTDRREEIYVPFNNLKDHSPWMDKGFWLNVNSGMQCFVLLKPGISQHAVNRALTGLIKKYYPAKEAGQWSFWLQPLSDIHFNADYEGKVSRKNLWILSLVGFFLIITACVNFINLSTAQALGRSKEIGVRKALGGVRTQLFWQFMVETAVLTSLAMVLAFVLAYMALPFVNRLLGVPLEINPLNDIHVLLFLPVLLLAVVFFSGSYPGLLLSRFRPVLALKGSLSQKHIGGFSLRKGLVITQFAICQLLIIGMIVIARQMHYAAQADLGFRKEAVVILPLPDHARSKVGSFGAELSQVAGVENTSFFSEAPSSENANNTGIRFDSRQEDEKFLLSYRVSDDKYVSTFGLQVLAGRNLRATDTIREFLLNEMAVKKLNAGTDVVGRQATINGDRGTIVGVIRDFHDKSFHGDIAPLCITSSSIWYFQCAVKINPADLQRVLPAIERVWKKSYPGYVYKYTFLDDQLARVYEQDDVFFRLIQVFAGMAIVIGCLGLYGLVSFMAARKRKEVGVRKVLGASVQEIVWLFCKEFARLVLAAFVIAAPLAWWTMNNWLENFVYRIQIGPGTFVITIVATLLMAIVTVGYRSVKAALVNPVRSLRSE